MGTLDRWVSPIDFDTTFGEGAVDPLKKKVAPEFGSDEWFADFGDTSAIAQPVANIGAGLLQANSLAGGQAQINRMQADQVQSGIDHRGEMIAGSRGRLGVQLRSADNTKAGAALAAADLLRKRKSTSINALNS